MAGAWPAGSTFFVLPVRGDTQLGIFMHLFSTNLDLNRFATRPQYYGMDRLITVGFWVSHVVVELIREVAIVSVHYPQRGVAVL